MATLATIIKTNHEDALRSLNRAIQARRAGRKVFKALRNLEIGSLSFSPAYYDNRIATCYIWVSRKVTSMDQTTRDITLIDNLPFDHLEKEAKDNGWETTDDKGEGVRRFIRTIFFHGVRFYICLTAIPVEGNEDGSRAKCRKVIVGQNTHTTTSPMYEIVCE